jgi:stage II sporulation protein D
MRLPLMLTLCLALLAPTVARADGDALGHGDRTASLYRDVLRIDGQGNPLLPMSVLSKADRLEVSASGGLRILGTNDGLVEFRVPGPVEVTSIDQKPGVYQHVVVLAQAPAYDFDTLRKQKAEWKARGLAVRTLGTGTNYSLAGRGFDTRVTLLCLDEALATDAAAEQKAAELERKYSVDLSVHAALAEPPTALLVAKGQGGSEVRAADVLWFEAVGKGTLHVSGSGKAGRKELDLPGRIYVVPGGHGGLEVVNEAELERILEGVVASEIFHSAPEAALRAQAVAARTDMLAKVGTRHATDPYAICSEVHCQAYTGMGKVSPRIAQAVKDTRGLVMVDAEGHLVDAYYHAVSGGHTEHNENAWPGRPQPALRGRADLVAGAKDWFAQGVTEQSVAAMLADKDGSWAAASGLNAEAERWTTEKTAQELQKTLAGYGVDKAVVAIRVSQRGASGRATEVVLDLQGGGSATIQGELRIRKALGGSAGPKGLRSSLFVVKAGPAQGGVPQKWTFTGAGFGHGVGMDQTGAVGRAKAGQDFRAILGHYYNAPKLETLY